MLLADNETRLDLLNNEAIAKTIVELLRARPEHPVTVGVHGDWGAGKSSVLEMIEATLDGEEGVLCLKFNGWRFQGFEDAKIALIEGIVTSLLEKRPTLTRATAAVKDVFRRIDWLKVAKKAGGLALTAFTGIPTPDQVAGALGAIQRLATDPAKLATKENLDAVADGVSSLLKPSGDTKNVPEEIGAFRAAFDRLLAEAEIDQLVVLIDDLDRCLPDTAIETLEAIRLFVFTPRTAFVVAADEAMIEYAVRKHFPELPDTTGPRDYARNYLEKLIQVPLRIPPLGETETRTFVTLLLVGADLADGDDAFRRLVETARDRLRRPWQSAAIDAAAVTSAFGANAKAHAALTLSEQIAPTLATGSQGNPRQIKRFLNALLLRERVANARGFGADIKLPALAKLMLAERFLPRTFDQIASVAAGSTTGRCDELAPLESAAGEASPPVRAETKRTKGVARRDDDTRDAEKTEGAPASPMLAEWLSSPAVVAWARVKPVLADVDLRPYLFVAKDRKDYFGATSALGRLGALAERLMGAEMQVRSMQTELMTLAFGEAAQLFDVVSGRVVGSGDFQVEPSGIAGLNVLVKAHPALEANLLGFLERLPADRLGAWAVKGWSGTINSADSKLRLERLLDSWTRSGGTILAAAAKSTLQTKGIR